MSYASPNGCFGRDISGNNHPMYGRKLTEESRRSISDTLKSRYASGTLTSPFKSMNTVGKNNPFFGKKHSEKTKEKMRKPKTHVPKYQCPHCDRIYDRGNLFQHMKRNGFSQDQIGLIKPEGWTAPSHADNHSILGILKGWKKLRKKWKKCTRPVDIGRVFAYIYLIKRDKAKV